MLSIPFSCENTWRTSVKHANSAEEKPLVARYWTRFVTDHMTGESITKITLNNKIWEIIRARCTDAAANYKAKQSPDRARKK